MIRAAGSASEPQALARCLRRDGRRPLPYSGTVGRLSHSSPPRDLKYPAARTDTSSTGPAWPRMTEHPVLAPEYTVIARLSP
ncbi:MAG: hypothetical protein MZU95_08460 [Desulfomicrobium escambiense]|nr:hypothetical protein [Desulfomicrobium escambiense]